MVDNGVELYYVAAEFFPDDESSKSTLGQVKGKEL